MLCESTVHMSEWPLGHRRDVDPRNERTQGLLRAGYIVPLVLRRSAPEPPVPTPELAPVEAEPLISPQTPAEEPVAASGVEDAPRAVHLEVTPERPAEKLAVESPRPARRKQGK